MSARTIFIAAALAFAPATAFADNVVIKNFAFGPTAVMVAKGTTVTWTNGDEEPHTVVSVDGLFRSQALDTGDTFKYTFDKPGTYRYICTIHPQMRATVTVQ